MTSAPQNHTATSLLHSIQASRSAKNPEVGPVLEIKVAPDQAATMKERLGAFTRGNRYCPDFHASEMRSFGGEILADALTDEDLQQLRLFGEGETSPILSFTGLPQQDFVPPTPHSGYNLDQSLVAFSDALLLGAYDLAGIDPIAYVFENYGNLFRNVCPNPHSAKERSSHGSLEPLGFHTDNPCSRFEFDSKSEGSPIPRYLGFTPLRNSDAAGKPVPTEVLPIDAVLNRVDSATLAALAQPDFRINPPASNSTVALTQVPLLVLHSGRSMMRFNAEETQVFGLNQNAADALLDFKSVLAKASADVLKFHLLPGRLLVFDNYRVFHCRRSFQMGTDWAQARWLRRCFGCQSIFSGRIADRVHQPYLWR